MERSEISLHEVKVFRMLETSKPRWLTNQEIAKSLKISNRTVRLHTLRGFNLRVLEQAQVFPGYRYRWAQRLDKLSSDYAKKLRQAAEVFGES